MDRIEILKGRLKAINNATKKARSFIDAILDAESFVETNGFAFYDKLTYDEGTENGEGVVTGYGSVDGIACAIFAQNFEVLKGGLGKAQADKIVKIIDYSYKMQLPLIAVLDSSGTRLGEGVEALEGYGKIFASLSKLAGYVPTIGVVKGRALGSIAYVASLLDYTFMCDGSILCTSSPEVIAAKANTTLSADKLCGDKMHAKNTGLNALSVKETDLKITISKFLDLVLCEKSGLDGVITGDLKLNGKTTTLEKLSLILDKNSDLTLCENFASDVVTKLGRINGISVGIIATKESANLSANGALKAARFATFLDNFELPLITVIDCEGLVQSVCDEQGSLVSDVATLIYSISESTNAKIALICGSATGVCYTALASKGLGFDYSLAWANAYVSPISKDTGAAIAFASEIGASKDRDKARIDAEEKYALMAGDPISAACGGHIDNIIEPSLSRPYLISALNMLKFKA